MVYDFNNYISGEELVAALEAKFDVVFDKDQRSNAFKELLIEIAECNLQPANAEILADKGLYIMDCASPIYYFPNVGDENYILIKKDLEVMKKSEVITVSEPAVENRSYLDNFFDDYTAYLKDNGRTINTCERYVIEQAQWWDVEDNYNAILSYYGLADCIVTTDFMEHTDIGVWVEHKYESANDVVLSSGYLKYLNGDIATFSSVEEAQARIDKIKSTIKKTATKMSKGKPDLANHAKKKETSYYITSTYPKP